MVEIPRLEAKPNLRKGRLILCISFSRIEAKPTMSIWTTSTGIVIPVKTGIQTSSRPRIKYGVNSSREPLYTLDPDFHRDPWIPAGVYPDENRGRNDGQKKTRTGKVDSKLTAS